MSKSTYTLTFRGETVETFTSALPEGYLVLQYKVNRANPWSRALTIARKPSRFGFFKTEAYAKTQQREQEYPGQRFIIGPIKPGTIEITEASPVEV